MNISALLILVGKADTFLVPCPIRYFTHFDCPGCGFQRSVIALLHGDLATSFALYPPTIPFLLSFFAGIATYIFKTDQNANYLKWLFIITGMIVVVNYMYKIFTHQLHFVAI